MQHSAGAALTVLGRVHVERVRFTANEVQNHPMPGAQAVLDNRGAATISWSLFDRNSLSLLTQPQAAVLYNAPGATMHVQRSAFTGNEAVANPSVGRNAGVLTVRDSIFDSSTSISSMCWGCVEPMLVSTGTLRATGVTVSNNHGGTPLALSGAATIDRSVVRNNFARTGPGGIKNSGDLEVTDTLLAHNSGYASAGAIENDGTLGLHRSALIQNHADAGGAGGLRNSGTAMLGNATIDGNTMAADSYFPPMSNFDGAGGIFNARRQRSV